MRIGVKFCGSCSPEIDPTKIYNVLKKLNNKDFKIEKINILEQSDNCDLLLLINGCRKGCLKKNNYTRVIEMDGRFFDGRFYKDIEILVSDLLEKIKKIEK